MSASKLVFLAVRDHFVEVEQEDGTVKEVLKKVRVTYSAGKRAEKNNKYALKIFNRNARRWAKLHPAAMADGEGPVEEVLQ